MTIEVVKLAPSQNNNYLNFISGLDMRSNSQAFRLEHNLLEGIQTAMAMAPDQNWLVSGTSSGVLTCWDLRFQLPIVTCTHPAESRIRQLAIPRSGKKVY